MCATFVGSCRKVTVISNTAVTVARHTLAYTHLPSLLLESRTFAFAVVPFAYRRHYLHVACKLFHFRSFATLSTRSAFVSAHGLPLVKCICPFAGLFINAHKRGNVYNTLRRSCTRKKLLELSGGGGGELSLVL